MLSQHRPHLINTVMSGVMVKRSVMLAKIKLAVLDDEFAHALVMLNDLIDEIRELNANRELVRLLVLKTTILYKQEECSHSIVSIQESLEYALATLREALEIGQLDHYIETFIEEKNIIKPFIEDLYHSVQQEGSNAISLVYLDGILQAFERDQSYLSSSDENVIIASPPSFLTKRELSILHLLDSGLLQKEIARELSLSINTVKWNVRNLYKKLEVGNRSGAIVKAHKIGII